MLAERSRPSARILRYSVERAMPSASAAWCLLPPASRSARTIVCASICSSAASWRRAARATYSGGRSAGPIRPAERPGGGTRTRGEPGQQIREVVEALAQRRHLEDRLEGVEQRVVGGRLTGTAAGGRQQPGRRGGPDTR